MDKQMFIDPGFKLIKYKELLKISVIKKKFLEQIPLISLKRFASLMEIDEPGTGIIGRIEDRLVLVRDNGFFYKIPSDIATEYLINQIKSARQLKGDEPLRYIELSYLAETNFRAIPQIFVD